MSPPQDPPPIRSAPLPGYRSHGTLQHQVNRRASLRFRGMLAGGAVTILCLLGSAVCQANGWRFAVAPALLSALSTLLAMLVGFDLVMLGCRCPVCRQRLRRRRIRRTHGPGEDGFLICDRYRIYADCHVSTD